MKKTQVYKLIAIFVFGVVLTLWISGLFPLWLYGISSIANNVEDYQLKTYPIAGEYSVTIDLQDLKSNEGKVLYDDGENQIYIESVFFRDESGYEISFRSSGTYKLSGATLVSGIEHARVNNGFTDFEQANANATYRSESFKLYYSGLSNLNYKDGDSFGFYLIPHEKEINVDFEKEKTMQLTLSNLYKHTWLKNN